MYVYRISFLNMSLSTIDKLNTIIKQIYIKEYKPKL